MEYKIVILSVATKNIPDKKIDKWKKSLEYYGYSYKLVSRDKNWSGYNMKLQDINNKLEKLDTEIVVLSDSTDLFFTAPPNELLEKFKNSNKDIIIGGEMELGVIGGEIF